MFKPDQENEGALLKAHLGSNIFPENYESTKVPTSGESQNEELAHSLGQIVIDSPEQMMFKHGKSFHFASQVFSQKVFVRISYLYAFCRFVDDTADELEPPTALKQLNNLQSKLGPDTSIDEDFSYSKADPPVSKTDSISASMLIAKLEGFGVKKEYLNVLVDGAISDVTEQKIHSKKDLLRYCYHVAGVVGLMMCPLIFVFKRKAYAFAIDLGIGMQLTNICRDVLEDAQNNRSYFPLEDLEKKRLSIDQLKQKGDTPSELKDLVKVYLDLADVYYKSSFVGFAYIPFRPRVAILFASDIYRSIGRKIRRSGYNVLEGRTYLSKTEKAVVCMISILKMFHPRFWWAGVHQPSLHWALQGLPEVLSDTGPTTSKDLP